MRNLKLVLLREPAAIGSLMASVLPALVLLGVIRIDEAGIAALVVAVNAVVGFGTRLLVSPAAVASAPVANEPATLATSG
ncbi:MAG TPA: hypothetical protein VKA57_06115 [Solirubrobacteraceae bacterium]|nr:hypothetical protein [Solirubrobacteraceae bacterium]